MPEYKTILALNRDEYYARPTEPAHFWPEVQGLLAGRDLQGGGTWFGVHESGRFASLTNFRSPAAHHSRKRSRGQIVTEFLSQSLSSAEYVEHLKSVSREFNDFNFLGSDGRETLAYNSRFQHLVRVGDGLFGLSNDRWETPWPKVTRGKKLVQKVLESGDAEPNLLQENLVKVLADRVRAPLDDLLSPLFIETEGYGTVSSTVVLVDHRNQIHFKEVTYARGIATLSREFHVKASP